MSRIRPPASFTLARRGGALGELDSFGPEGKASFKLVNRPLSNHNARLYTLVQHPFDGASLLYTTCHWLSP